MTLLLFSLRHASLLTVHRDFQGHTASKCICRSRPLQWCAMYLSRLSGCPKSSQRETMLVIFFDRQSVIHNEFVPKGETINAVHYKVVMERLLNRIRRVRPYVHRASIVSLPRTRHFYNKIGFHSILSRIYTYNL